MQLYQLYAPSNSDDTHPSILMGCTVEMEDCFDSGVDARPRARTHQGDVNLEASGQFYIQRNSSSKK